MRLLMRSSITSFHHLSEQPRMAYWDSELQGVRSPILRYGFAVVSVVVATAIALAIQEYQVRDVELPLLVLVIGLAKPRFAQTFEESLPIGHSCEPPQGSDNSRAMPAVGPSGGPGMSALAPLLGVKRTSAPLCFMSARQICLGFIFLNQGDRPLVAGPF
jgi:hypothetical protein